MTKKKTPAPAPTPGIGNNSAGVTAEIFNRHLALIEAAEAACKTANQNRAQLRKAARADGIILGIFDAMRKLVELPRLEQIQRWEFSLDCLRFMRNPVGSQITFDFSSVDPFNETDEAAKVRIAADAEAEGYRAGLAGVLWEDNNPHEVSSDAGQGWIKGWREGQTNRAEALGDDVNTGS